jgi:hypothetical protein
MDEHRSMAFQKMLLRTTFGSKKEGVTSGWRNLYNEEHRSCYSLPNIIGVMKSRLVRWTVNVARI